MNQKKRQIIRKIQENRITASLKKAVIQRNPQKEKKEIEIPETELLEAEVNRLRYRSRFVNILKSTVYSLVVVAAVAVLVATIWMPVLQIYGSSMNPTLEEGNIVVSLKGSEFERGDLVAFYIGNKILVKRYIAGPGQWVNIDEDGNVYVDGEKLEEPYITDKSFGDCNIELPYQVLDNRYFCMGDHRSTSVDSRHAEVGCISEEQIVGKIVWRVWPISEIGELN